MTLQVALVTPPPDASGGIGRLVQAEIEFFDKNYGQDLSVELLDSRGGRLSLSGFYTAAVVWRLWRLKRRRKVDLVHINMSTRASTLRKSIILLAAQSFSIPTVLHLHGSGYDEFYETLPRIFKKCVALIFRTANCVIVLGGYWERFVVEACGVEAERVAVIPNAVPSQPSEVEPLARIPGEPMRVAFLGKVSQRKGTTLLVTAACRLLEEQRSLTVDVAGDGEVEALRELVASHGLENSVKVYGWSSRDQCNALLRRSHVFCLPSRAENQPMSILEAMAAGLPVISTEVGAIPEVVAHGSSGLLINRVDENALASALREYHDNEGLRYLHAVQSRKNFESQFTIDKHCDTLFRRWLEVSREVGKS